MVSYQKSAVSGQQNIIPIPDPVPLSGRRRGCKKVKGEKNR
jgi:hypothetical protein